MNSNTTSNAGAGNMSFQNGGLLKPQTKRSMILSGFNILGKLSYVKTAPKCFSLKLHEISF